MQRRWIVALAAIAFASPASAQFTTFIAPPSPVKDSIKAAVVAEQHALADSITQTKITDMKTWVDSAAGLAPLRARDTATVVDTASRTTVTANGVVAPQTASPLPLMIALGGVMMLVGVTLSRRPRAQRQRADR